MEITAEEYAPEIVYNKGIHNTVADAISRLEYNPTLNLTGEHSHATMWIPTAEPSTNPKRWKAFSKHWHSYNQCHAITDTKLFQLDQVFANCSEEDEIYPLTTKEIAEALKANATYTHLFKRNAVVDQGLEINLIENTLCVCKDGWLVIYKPVQRRAVLWYHHHLQHPGHTHLEEMMKAAMYWEGMHTTIRSLTKSCKTCPINKRRCKKYGHLPAKLVISTP